MMKQRKGLTRAKETEKSFTLGPSLSLRPDPPSWNKRGNLSYKPWLDLLQARRRFCSNVWHEYSYVYTNMYLLCVCANSAGSGDTGRIRSLILAFVACTINSEIFARTLFSRIALKDIFATLKIRDYGTIWPKSVNDSNLAEILSREFFSRHVAYMYAYTKFRENKNPRENLRFYSIYDGYQHLKDWFIYTYGKKCVICPLLFCSFSSPQHVAVLNSQLVYLRLYCRTFIRIKSMYLRPPDKEPRSKEPSPVTCAGRMILYPFLTSSE